MSNHAWKTKILPLLGGGLCCCGICWPSGAVWKMTGWYIWGWAIAGGIGCMIGLWVCGRGGVGTCGYFCNTNKSYLGSYTRQNKCCCQLQLKYNAVSHNFNLQKLIENYNIHVKIEVTNQKSYQKFTHNTFTFLKLHQIKPFCNNNLYSLYNYESLKLIFTGCHGFCCVKVNIHWLSWFLFCVKVNIHWLSWFLFCAKVNIHWLSWFLFCVKVNIHWLSWFLFCVNVNIHWLSWFLFCVS
jgi:hypothetical protein